MGSRNYPLRGGKHSIWVRSVTLTGKGGLYLVGTNCSARRVAPAARHLCGPGPALDLLSPVWSARLSKC